MFDPELGYLITGVIPNGDQPVRPKPILLSHPNLLKRRREKRRREEATIDLEGRPEGKGGEAPYLSI